MTDNPFVPALTPADVMDLRSTCTTLRGIYPGPMLPHPYILYLPADDLFCLCAYGSPQAKSANPAVLAACLRAERAEAGFIRRILSSEEPCDVATLAPDARARHASLVAQEAARRRQAAQEADDRRLRLGSHLDPAKISLDDI